MPLADTLIIQNDDRLESLRSLCLLDTPADPSFDRLAELAATILRVPVALVTLVDAGRQFFKSQIGLPDPWSTTRETPLSHSFCQHVVAHAQPLIIDDARSHPLVYDNLAIMDLNVIAYAGIPLITSDHHSIGSFCIIDHKPRHWTAEEIEILTKLAASVMTEVELRAEILEREHVEQMLRDRERFIHQVVNTSPSVIYVYNVADGSMVYASPASKEVMGYSSEELQAMPSAAIRALIHPDDLTELSLRKQSLTSGPDDAAVTFEYRMRHSDRHQIWLRSIETVFTRDDEGNPLQAIGVAQDITRHKAVEQERETLLSRITDLEQLKSDMIRVAAHDLRAPLSIVMGYAGLLDGDDLTPSQHDFVEQISAGAMRMERMIRDILSLERIEAYASGQQEPVNLTPMVQKAFEERRLQAEQKDQTYSLTLPQQPVVVMGDAVQLREAVDNLIGNAIKYTPQSGHVMVRLTDTGRFEVEDTGCGIPENQQKSLFSPFFRARTAETQNIEGTGLGLHLVKRIIERHKGKMHFRSEYGKGSVFGFQLEALPEPVI